MMKAATGVLASYGFALRHAGLFSALYLSVQALTAAVVVPLTGGLVRLAVNISGQSALTDQDIAGFLLHPVGLAVGIGLIAVLLIAETLGFALAVAAQNTPNAGPLTGLRRAYPRVMNRLPQLLWFGILMVLRVLVLIAPFALLAGWAWLHWLTNYDINYYLTNRPPEFIRAALVIGIALVAGCALVLARSSGWLAAVHLILLDDCPAREAFGRSRDRLHGQRIRIITAVAGWALVRLGSGAVLAALVAGAAGIIPVSTERLGLALALMALLAVFWVLANLFVGGISLAALAHMVTANLHLDMRDDRAAQQAPRPAIFAGALVVILIGAGITALLLLTAPAPREEVAIIAHRGGAIYRPENTMAAIDKGLADGADWIEIDVQETADGAVVVVHDSDFMKLAGVDLKIWDATLADLADIDIGSAFDPVYADQRTPLLSEVLERVRDTSTAGVLIELKYYGHDVRLEERVTDIVEAAGMADRIEIMSLKYGAVQKMAALRPDWPVGVLAATALGDLAGLDGDFVALSATMATPGRIRAAERAGKAFYVWTVNDPFEMSRMISKGVDGLITDDPAMARSVVDFRARLTTPQRLLLGLADLVGVDAARAPAIPAAN